MADHIDFMSSRFFKVTYRLLLLLTLSVSLSSYSSENKAANLHISAWRKIAQQALNNVDAKYAIYGSRSIAVVHPEIYLRADLEMLEWMRTHPKDVVATSKPAPVPLKLSWQWLQKMPIAKASELYPNNAPFLTFLDRRLLPPTAVLRKLGVKNNVLVIADQEKITELNKAVLAYYLQKQIKNSYILYCADESAYLLSHNQSIAMKNMQSETVSCNPVLIFNRSYVWYPLMGRDDTSASKQLAVFVKRYANPEAPQMIDDSQLQLINVLKSATEISDDNEYQKINLIVKNTTPIVYFENNKLKIENPRNLQQWQKFSHDHDILDELTIQRIHTGMSSLILQGIHIKSDELSLLAAYLASIIVNKSPHDAANLLSKTYSDYFRWGEVWQWGLTDFTMDESLSAGGEGVCVTHSNNIAAVLNLAGISYYTIHTYNIGKNKDHRFVYVPSWKATFSNGILSAKSGQTIFDPPGFHSIVYIQHADQWAFFAPPIFLGDMDKKEIATALQFLRNEFGDTLEGVKIFQEWIHDKKPVSLSFDDLLEFLKN